MPVLFADLGTQRTSTDVHLELERDIASFLNVPAAIIYAQAFSCVSSVIPSFCKRGDIIVADRSVNFAIQKGIQISRSTVRWYDHGDYQGLERVLESIRKDDKKYKRNPTASRRFIITEGVFENDGSMVNLPKVVRGCRSRRGHKGDTPLTPTYCTARTQAQVQVPPDPRRKLVFRLDRQDRSRCDGIL